MACPSQTRVNKPSQNQENDQDFSKKTTQHKETRTKTRYLPFEVRYQLYNEVLKLKAKGLGQKKILKEILKRHGVKLSTAQVSHWIRGIHSPLGNVKAPLRQGPALAYLIGTILSDGNTYLLPQKGRVKLEVKDREFAEEFYAKAVEVGLNPVKPKPQRNKWFVQFYSKYLVYLIKTGRWKELIQTIDDKRAFLRGFFRR